MRIIDANKIKYAVLENILPKFNDKNKLIIHIDLNSILRSILSPTVIISASDKITQESAVSSIINMIAHYREYFIRQNIVTHFFLYYNKDIKKNKDILEYGNKYYNKINGSSIDFFDKYTFITNVLKSVQDIIKYIPKAYYIEDDNNENYVNALYFLNQKDYNLIISKDILWYQLVNSDNTILLRPKRDDSYIINKGNIFDYELKSYKKYYKDLKNISILLASHGVKSRGLTRFKHDKEVKENIDTSITYGDFSISLFDIEDKEELIQRFRLVDAKYQLSIITQIESSKLDEQLIDKYNYKFLRDLNKIYKKDNLLQLEELVVGVGGATNVKRKLEWSSGQC